MAKNIIVCADGTGNKGGYSPDSNVYKIYKAVDKNFNGDVANSTAISEQIVFYDNGVGTAKNKYLRALTGALGFGFGDNVCDLYKYLARNYEPGDHIYFFGFSRGASTVRACNGMISKCGLVKGKGKRNRELDKLVEEAFDIYKRHKKNPSAAEKYKDSEQSHGAVTIRFLGIWDTVVALGFPKRTDITDLLMRILDFLFGAFEELLDQDFAWPHSFYHYKLTDNVEYACQALSIDDERTAFWPYVWQEKNIDGARNRTLDNVEQVWFAGMHSNVGGGYEREGMAGVALHWMVNRAQHHGLVFEPNELQEIYSTCHVHGRMYNSRDGFGFLYRYHPREIEQLCKDKLQGKIKIHRSVIERMNHRTANYAPGFIPAEFDVVDSAVPANVIPMSPGENDQWKITRRLIDKTVLYRKQWYSLMLAIIIFIVTIAISLNSDAGKMTTDGSISGMIADILYTILPDFFTGLINVAVVKQPLYLLATIVSLYSIFKVRKHFYNKMVNLCETLRHYVIDDTEKLLEIDKVKEIKNESK
ncbi:MAG: hypothetical protein GQ550_09285 [Gammaproteobacteria bacterium]|nr:hypothetical protein [Gammaproteobacteria bacterium]